MIFIRKFNKPRIMKHLGGCLKTKMMLIFVENVLFTVPFTAIIRTINSHYLKYIIAILIIPMGYGVNFVMFLNICRGEEVNFSYLKIGYKEFF